jgi:hypothetical protein
MLNAAAAAGSVLLLIWYLRGGHLPLVCSRSSASSSAIT